MVSARGYRVARRASEPAKVGGQSVQVEKRRHARILALPERIAQEPYQPPHFELPQAREGNRAPEDRVLG